MRMHTTYYTERMLSRPPALARIGAIASLARERCDGSGYHRGLSGPAIPVTGRLLAAACAYRAMTEPRSYRAAMTAKHASSELYAELHAEVRAEVRAGRLDVDAVEAVLAAAGHSHGRRRAGPAGLTPREIEVLQLIARGASTRRVAQGLHITSPISTARRFTFGSSTWTGSGSWLPSGSFPTTPPTSMSSCTWPRPPNSSRTRRSSRETRGRTP
jgi:hypothetical protein